MYPCIILDYNAKYFTSKIAQQVSTSIKKKQPIKKRIKKTYSKLHDNKQLDLDQSGVTGDQMTNGQTNYRQLIITLLYIIEYLWFLK